MKNLGYLLSGGRSFFVDEENIFFVTNEDLRHISRIGVLVNTLFKTTMGGLIGGSSEASRILFDGLGIDYQALSVAHPEYCPVLFRVDLMIDLNGDWQIAEIDPSNKHGLGFALATRYESGAGDRQKILTLLAPYVTDDVSIVLGRRESFYAREQKFFAGRLAGHTGKKVVVVPEENITKLQDGGLIFDFPFCSDETRALLAKRFMEQPESFINPPRHVLGGKALMTLPYEHVGWLEATGMDIVEIDELRTYLPPTYSGPFVVKEVFSSGAKGVFFDAVGKKTVSQRYTPQRSFDLGEGRPRFIRMAGHFVGGSLGELTVSATTTLPVHGGNDTVNYHVGLK